MKSLAEIRRHWSILDIMTANEALDVWDELERKAHEASR